MTIHFIFFTITITKREISLEEAELRWKWEQRYAQLEQERDKLLHENPYLFNIR